MRVSILIRTGWDQRLAERDGFRTDRTERSQVRPSACKPGPCGAGVCGHRSGRMKREQEPAVVPVSVSLFR